MRDNGERIYCGLVEKEPMEKLEEENMQPNEAELSWEHDNRQLPELLAALEKNPPQYSLG